MTGLGVRALLAFNDLTYYDEFFCYLWAEFQCQKGSVAITGGEDDGFDIAFGKSFCGDLQCSFTVLCSTLFEIQDLRNGFLLLE